MERFDRPIRDEGETDAFGRALGRVLRAGDVIVLEGGLGAGKTAFVRAVAYGLGLDEDEPVTSPSFAVVQEYPTNPPLLHADLYRLAHSDELLQLGLDESALAASVACVEWGLAHREALPHVDLVLTISGSGDEPRQFSTVAHSKRGIALLEAWCDLATREIVW